MSAVDVPLAEMEFVAFDLETTGLYPATCRIVEVGAVRFRGDGTELDRFEQLVDPGCAMPAAAMRIHHITDGMVRGQPSVAETLPRFVEFLGGAESLLMAHNARFDLGFLGVALGAERVAPPPHVVIDTCALARRCASGFPSYRLEALARAFGLATREDHRALSDARLAAGMFRCLLACRPELKTRGNLLALCQPMGFQADPPPMPALSAALAPLAEALEGRQTVIIFYDGGRGLAERRITPRQLRASGDCGYLIAWCHRDLMEKTYRLDRIRAVRVERDPCAS